ncbi:PR domain zinc finger protein 13 [Diachasma alloeum]|uniref:PR domain zinc finger protein 13 n=1 Tax=Diachasma alloeum TaxID=454923 RepID=UPI0010FAD919|nr:PR domain zinc finger protein 13 [Diachasma alloeum]
MNIRALERTAISASRLAPRPGVRAATLLNPDASTEVIDINDLAQKSSSVIQYVEVADNNGRLYCVNGLVNSACWIKIVTLAKDCQSCNVLLMSTEEGVVLKTIRVISPGEPLLMWFTENILAMMHMPFLTPYLNIQGENRYICHICNNLFEYPNPLKIHLALKCNKLDPNHLWATLAKEFALASPLSLSLNLFPPVVGSSFKFHISESLRASVKTVNASKLPANTSPTPSNGPSPTSSTQVSPISSSTEVSPVRSTITQRNSAFRPYMSRSSSRHSYTSHTSHSTHIANQINSVNYNHHHRHQLPPPPIHADVHAAQMETFYSNIGKSKQGHLCVYCGKVYSRKYGLKIHIRTHTGYKPLKCKVCLRPFGDPSNLNKHVRLHADGETPYRCEHCGKVLVRRRDLDRHIRSRHQENAGHISDTSSDGLEV